MEILYCSFCGKSDQEAEHMIASAGEHPAVICDECTDLCSKIIAEKRLAGAKRAGTDVAVLPKAHRP